MSEMRTLNVEEACSFLKLHKSTLYQKIAAGEIPAAKVGKARVFVELDLVGYIRKQYKVGQEATCHSTNRKVPTTGVSTITQQALCNKISNLETAGYDLKTGKHVIQRGIWRSRVIV